MQRVNAERLAAIKAARAKMTQGEWTSTDNAMGAWIVYFEDDEASVDRIWFGDMESNTGRDIANADGITLLVNSIDDILADLEEARAHSAEQAIEKVDGALRGGVTRDILRDMLGRATHEGWAACTNERAKPEGPIAVAWDELAEEDREVSRRMGERAAVTVLGLMATLPEAEEWAERMQALIDRTEETS